MTHIPIMKKLILFLLFTCFFTPIFAQDIKLYKHSQEDKSQVKIYSYKNYAVFGKDIYNDETWWIFYKIDWKEKTIQIVNFTFKEGDSLPNLTNVSNLFKDSDIENFIILNSNKIKVKRVPKERRAWNDFATARKESSATKASIYNFVNDTFTGKNKGLRFVLDQDLTNRYQEEQHNIK